MKKMYTVTHKETGKKVRFAFDGTPTEDHIDQVFKNQDQMDKSIKNPVKSAESMKVIQDHENRLASIRNPVASFSPNSGELPKEDNEIIDNEPDDDTDENEDFLDYHDKLMKLGELADSEQENPDGNTDRNSDKKVSHISSLVKAAKKAGVDSESFKYDLMNSGVSDPSHIELASSVLDD